MVLLAIDGPAGAGKTTYATKLGQEFSAHSLVHIIHLDDLYHGWEDALSPQLTLQLRQITESHIAGVQFTIKKFNWMSMKFDQPEVIAPSQVLIIEGVGAAQKVVRDAGATTYWIDVSPELGLQRVLDRDGAHLELLMRQWQIDQDRHFHEDQTRVNCEFHLTS